MYSQSVDLISYHIISYKHSIVGFWSKRLCLLLLFFDTLFAAHLIHADLNFQLLSLSNVHCVVNRIIWMLMQMGMTVRMRISWRCCWSWGAFRNTSYSCYSRRTWSRLIQWRSHLFKHIIRQCTNVLSMILRRRWPTCGCGINTYILYSMES